MTTTANINYTDAQTAELVQAYQAGEAVEALAERFQKSVRSIVAKLSREGVYKKKEAKGTGRVTKAALIQYMEELLQLDPQSLQSLEKAQTAQLQALATAITNRVN
jgi:hypothetical protein